MLITHEQSLEFPGLKRAEIGICPIGNLIFYEKISILSNENFFGRLKKNALKFGFFKFSFLEPIYTV